uniref:Tethering factor for nuclear proteasome STS1 n=2 Tax=Kalmanozyma brasiliensis (strain GHG001) TaxID=1365824 RepID=V5EY91_KALBG
MSGIDVDIGKMLASMDKPSLLSMLSSLLLQSTDATLPAQILSLLPTPSLDSVESSLDELEKAIRSAIPFVADGSTARHEYTWSRLRAPIAAFVDAALGYLPFFVTELDSDREQRLRERDPRLQADREEVHPATTFTFLLMITSRVLRIEALLPSVTKSSLAFNLFTASSQQTSFGFGAGGSTPTTPSKMVATDAYGKHSNLAYMLGTEFAQPSSPDALMTVLMPAILKQWTTLLHRLDKAVNGDGRMFSQEMVLTWARALEATGTVKREEQKAEEMLIRKAMDEVRNRLERDLAWLVGGTQYAVQKREKRGRGSSMSDGEEEL